MKRDDGIALVASLIVLMVVLALGIGASFLTQMNLRIAENNQANASARYNAETGLDTALVALARYFRESKGEFPATESAFNNLFAGAEFYEVQHYERFAEDQVQIVIAGHAPNRNAEYIAEARLQGVITPSLLEPKVDPLFGEGFVSEAGIEFSGNSNLDLNVWSGKSVRFTGGKSTLAKGRYARSGTLTCEIAKAECDKEHKPPAVPIFNFANERVRLIESITGDATGIVPLSFCSRALDGKNTIPGPLTDEVICLAPGASLTLNGVSKKVVVIGDESTSVAINGGSEPYSIEDPLGLTVVSGTVTFGKVPGACDKDVDKGEVDKCKGLTGQNTIFAKGGERDKDGGFGELEFGKGVTSTDDVTRTLIASESDIQIIGNGGRDIYASFWTAGNMRINGHIGTLVGTIVAKGKSEIGITGKGGVELARLPSSIENPYLPTIDVTDYSGAGIRVLSRR